MTRSTDAVALDSNRAAQLSALYDLALRLSGVHELTALLQDIVTQARRLIVADVAYLALLEDDRSMTINVTDGSMGPRLRGTRLAPGTGLAGQVVETGEPVQSIEYLADAEFTHLQGADQVAVEEGLRTILGVPLRARGTVIGVLMVALRKSRSFSSDELSLLSSLAALAAVAIENVRLIERYREAAAELARTNLELEERVDSAARAAELHDRMLEVALKTGGVEDVLVSLSSVIDGTVVLLDESDHVRGRAVDGRVMHGGDDGAVGAPVAALFADTAHHRTVVRPDRVVVPLATPQAYYGALQLCDADPSEWVVRALERAAMTLTLVAAAERAEFEAERRSATELLEQVLTRRVENEQSFARRARPMGLDIGVAHVVLVLRPRPERVARVLARAGELVGRSGGLAGVVLGAVVVLTRAAESTVREFAAAELRTGNAGLGGPATGAAELAAAYDDARACAAVLDALDRHGACAAPADLGPYRFLLSESGRTDAERFVGLTIGPLLTHDTDRGSDLARTAETFLGTGRQHAATAAALQIHANTLYQRLERITAQLGEGWRTGDRALDVQMALRIHRLMSAG